MIKSNHMSAEKMIYLLIVESIVENIAEDHQNRRVHKWNDMLLQ